MKTYEEIQFVTQLTSLPKIQSKFLATVITHNALMFQI